MKSISLSTCMALVMTCSAPALADDSTDCRNLSIWINTIQTSLPTATQCSDIANWRAQLGSVAPKCNASGLRAREATLQLELRNKACVARAVKPKGETATTLPKQEPLCSGLEPKPSTSDPVADGREHVTALSAYVQRCAAESARCSDREACEHEFVRATIAYLTTIRGLREHESEALRFLSGIVPLSAVTQDQALAALGRLGPEGSKVAMAALVDHLKSSDSDSLQQRLKLWQALDNPDALKRLDAAAEWLLQQNTEKAVAFRKLLGQPHLDRTAISKLVEGLETQQREAIVTYAGVAVDEGARARRGVQRGARRLLVVYGGKGDKCEDYDGHFKLSLMKALTDASLGGIRAPLVVKDPTFFAPTLDYARCRCTRSAAACSELRNGLAEDLSTYVDHGGPCEGVLAVSVQRNEQEKLEINGSIHLAAHIQGVDSGTDWSISRLSTPVGVRAECSPKDQDEQRGAAMSVLKGAWHAMNAIEYLPMRLKVEREIVPSPMVPRADASMWNAALLSGLPHLSDGRPANDTAGYLWAGSDLALVGGTLVVGGLAMASRNQYADSHSSGDLDRANTLLGFAIGGLVAVAVVRTASAIQYELSR